ncbi:MAG TPA: hypothetical protein VM941_09745, partial [Pyrinomonadaceae bacterium]|nr:hypothetical protein [Pyrinomonadaceae bacterium]
YWFSLKSGTGSVENTPKAFANFSPGFERSENPGSLMQLRFNPERVRLNWNPYRVSGLLLYVDPKVVAVLQPLG